MFEPGERWGSVKPTEAETPGWVTVGISAGAPIDVCGVDPLAKAHQRWSALHKWIVVSHPEYPAQRHSADVYTLPASDGHNVMFAAAELSNGVWGFYVPSSIPGDAGSLS